MFASSYSLESFSPELCCLNNRLVICGKEHGSKCARALLPYMIGTILDTGCVMYDVD